MPGRHIIKEQNNRRLVPGGPRRLIATGGIDIFRIMRELHILRACSRIMRYRHGSYEKANDIMIFGEINRFAIELDLCNEGADIEMYGQVCYWISGNRIGNFDLVDSLRDVLFCWERMACDKNRSGQELLQLNTQDLLRTLYCGLYGHGCPDQDTDLNRGIEFEWARHNINPGTLGFSGWRVFVVESPDIARCVYAQTDGIAMEESLRLGEFDNALDGAIAYLLAEYQRLGGA